ncbi:MAG: T9SS type A sorting domain-containing protein [Bacteroidota bacterium]
MKNLMLISLVVLNGITLFGQGKFFKIYDDNAYDYGQGIIQLKDSSYMVTGSSSSFMDAPSQAFLMKIDKNGNHIWAKDYGYEEGDGGKRVLSAFNDSIFFIIGYTQSSTGNGFDILFVKTDSNGVQLEKKVIALDNWERINDAKIMGDSMLYLVGETTNTANLNSNFLLVKMDVNGDTLWTKNWGTSGDDYLKAIEPLDNNSFLSVGAVYNADSSMTKCYVTKFDFNGVVAWEKQYGANGKYWLNDFYIYQNHIFASGGNWNETYQDKDEFFLRINTDGSPYSWDFESPEEGEREALGAVLYGDSSKSYVVRHFNNNFSAENSYDLSYMRYENNLDFEWSTSNIPTVTLGFPLDDAFGEIIPTSDGGWVATGTTPSQTNGGAAVYVLKVGPNDDLPTINLASVQSLVEVINLEDVAVKLYPNPVITSLTIDGLTSKTLVTIKDVQGKELFSSFINDSATISFVEWNSGIYLVTLQTETEERSTVRIIKN